MHLGRVGGRGDDLAAARAELRSAVAEGDDLSRADKGEVLREGGELGNSCVRLYCGSVIACGQH
jgi:hypothetical protein